MTLEESGQTLEKILEILVESWQVFADMSAYLIFGFIVAGVLSVVISPSWVEKHLGGSGFGPVVKASLFGIPLPLCSCGVIPVAASMRHQGSSKAATTSFLLSTPQTGVDSIAITYAALGLVFSVFRPIAALITGLVGGVLVLLFGKNDRKYPQSNKEKTNLHGGNSAKSSQSIIKRILDYGLIRLPGDIGSALVLGILISGAMTVFIPKDFLEAYFTTGILSILIMMIAGVPVYVCATASVPIVAGFIHIGASPGAALAFLIAGPATNAAAFTTTWNFLGKRTAIIYLLTIAGSAIGFGMLLNWMVPYFDISINLNLGHDHHESKGWLNHVYSIGLVLILVYSYIKVKLNKTEVIGSSEMYDSNHDNYDSHLTLNVAGMSCSHCSDSVEKAIGNHSDVKAVSVVLKTGQTTISGDNLNKTDFVDIIKQLGYTVVDS